MLGDKKLVAAAMGTDDADQESSDTSFVASRDENGEL
jgi:hypothetical protein